MTATLLITALSATLLGATANPCQLVTADEIRTALGKAPSGGESDGPTRDEGSGARLTSCGQQVGDQYLDITVAEFTTPAAVDKAMTELANRKPDDEDEAKMLPAAGVG